MNGRVSISKQFPKYFFKLENREPKSETFLQEKIIFMTIQEFFSIYSHIHVCHYNENFMYNHITMRHVPQVYSIAKFSTHVNSDCFFELTQIDHRFYRGDPKYQYSISRFLIFKIIDGQPYYIGGNISTSKYNTLKMNITEGNYYVVGVLDWKGDVYDFNFSAYSEGDVYFERVHYNENPDIISQLFKPYIEDKTAARTPSRNKDFLKYEKTIDELQLRVELFVNNSNSKTLNLKKKISKMENASLLNIVPNEKNDIETQAFPQSSKLILVGSSQFSKPFVYVYEDK